MINRDEIRVFIAIELPDELKSRLRELENKLKTPKSSCARWVDPGAIHLTLKFLGNTGAKLLDELKRDVEAEVRKSQPLILETTETGCFPNTLRPRVFWLGLGGDIDRLLDLQSRIDECAGRLGFHRESRLFTAHLTLARLRDDCSVAQRSGFAELVKGVWLEPGFSIHVSAVSLIRSQLRPEGAIYTRLARFEMTDG